MPSFPTFAGGESVHLPYTQEQEFWNVTNRQPHGYQYSYNLLAAGLKRWLSLFHVHYRPEVHDAIAALGRSGRAHVAFESVARRYAYIATITRR